MVGSHYASALAWKAARGWSRVAAGHFRSSGPRLNQRTLLLLASALLIGVVGCIEPKDDRPGFRLSGEIVNGPVNDWSFVDDVQQVFVETRSWYLLPHSVTTGVATYNGTLYVPAIYSQGGTFPEGRLWNRNIVRDSHVRLKIGEKIYPRRAALVTDAAEIDAVFAAFADKYDLWKNLLAKPPDQRPAVYFVRMAAETIPATP
jgi:hypothetical protein